LKITKSNEKNELILARDFGSFFSILDTTTTTTIAMFFVWLKNFGLFAL